MESTDEVSCAPHSGGTGRQHQQQQEHQIRVLKDQDHADDPPPLEFAGPAAVGHSPHRRDREEVEASRTYKRLMLEDTASATSLRMGLSKQSRAAQVRLQQQAAVATGAYIYCALVLTWYYLAAYQNTVYRIGTYVRT